MTADAKATTHDWTAPGVYPVAPGVHRVPLPLPTDGLRAVNVYVVEDDGGLVLIDSGWARAGPHRSPPRWLPSAPGSATSARSWSRTFAATTTRWRSSCAGSSRRGVLGLGSGEPSGAVRRHRSWSRRNWRGCGPAGPRAQPAARRDRPLAARRHRRLGGTGPVAPPPQESAERPHPTTRSPRPAPGHGVQDPRGLLFAGDHVPHHPVDQVRSGCRRQRCMTSPVVAAGPQPPDMRLLPHGAGYGQRYAASTNCGPPR